MEVVAQVLLSMRNQEQSEIIMMDNDLYQLSSQLKGVQTCLTNAIAWNLSDSINQRNKDSLIDAIGQISKSAPDVYNFLVKQIDDGTLVVSGINDPDNNVCGNDVYTINFTLDELFKIILTFTESRDCDSWIISDENVEVIWLNPEKSKSQVSELLHQAILNEASAMAESILKREYCDDGYLFEDTPAMAEFDQGLLKVLNNSLNKPDNTKHEYFLVKTRVVICEDSSIAFSLIAAENADIAQDFAIALESGESNLEWDTNGAAKSCGYPRYDYYNCNPVNVHEINTIKQFHDVYEADLGELVSNGNWAELNS
ncbi:conserved hypothetical protein [Vibrio jasicida]|uniref:Uncharacterized protein n=1 Tax=Vibrio jasicida TaxID=766224 RepID=A0AAU9QU16_9VIBR|nr:conserved hypothetical protein [Vibrio jasicida]CAH1599983.1 conserved hypothetical protein [Vibrio jasicida]